MSKSKTSTKVDIDLDQAPWQTILKALEPLTAATDRRDRRLNRSMDGECYRERPECAMDEKAIWEAAKHFRKVLDECIPTPIGRHTIGGVDELHEAREKLSYYSQFALHPLANQSLSDAREIIKRHLPDTSTPPGYHYVTDGPRRKLYEMCFPNGKDKTRKYTALDTLAKSRRIILKRMSPTSHQTILFARDEADKLRWLKQLDKLS